MHTKHQARQIDRILPGTPQVISRHLKGWWNDTDWLGFSDLCDLVAGKTPGPLDVVAMVSRYPERM